MFRPEKRAAGKGGNSCQEGSCGFEKVLLTSIFLLLLSKHLLIWIGPIELALGPAAVYATTKIHKGKTRRRTNNDATDKHIS